MSPEAWSQWIQWLLFQAQWAVSGGLDQWRDAVQTLRVLFVVLEEEGEQCLLASTHFTVMVGILSILVGSAHRNGRVGKLIPIKSNSHFFWALILSKTEIQAHLVFLCLLCWNSHTLGFYKLKVCSNSALSKSVGTVFPTARVHWVSLSCFGHSHNTWNFCTIVNLLWSVINDNSLTAQMIAFFSNKAY